MSVLPNVKVQACLYPTRQKKAEPLKGFKARWVLPYYSGSQPLRWDDIYRNLSNHSLPGRHRLLCHHLLVLSV